MALVLSVLKDLTGQRFGRLTVLSYSHSRRGAGSSRATYATWRCLCDCGAETVKEGRALKAGRTRSCGCLLKESRSINGKRLALKAPRLTGSSHPNWNHDLSNEDRAVTRKTSEYSSWRRAVLERDGYTCQVCLKVGGRLQAHHLSSFRRNPDGRYDIENGVAVCRPCHDGFHSAYGKALFTSEDFLEYQQLNRPSLSAPPMEPGLCPPAKRTSRRDNPVCRRSPSTPDR